MTRHSIARMGHLALALCLTMGITRSAIGQTPWQKLEKAEATLNEARRQDIDILSPRAFQKAVEILNEARDRFTRNDNIPELQKRLQLFTEAQMAARYNANIVKQTIPEVLEARTDAIRRRAPKIAAKRFKEGEKWFGDVIRNIEKGRLSEAKKRARKVEINFRDAELKAIKINTLDEAKETLKKAKRAKSKEYAPLSYGRADSLIIAADLLLSQDRYAGKQAARMANEAEYQARLSIYLTRLAREARKQKDALERQFLGTANYVSQIARALGVDAKYDKGYKKLVTEMLLEVENLKQKNLTLSQ